MPLLSESQHTTKTKRNITSRHQKNPLVSKFWTSKTYLSKMRTIDFNQREKERKNTSKMIANKQEVKT